MSKPMCNVCSKHPVHARDRCQGCYNREYHKQRHEYRGPNYEGVVRVPVSGWGYRS